MRDSAIATAADYADAMLVARRSKNALVLLLLVMLLTQLALFFTARYSDALFAPSAQAVETPAGTTQPVPVVKTTPLRPAGRWVDPMQYLIGATNFLGIAFGIVLSFVLLLLVKIMLVGRLIGVARVTSAYIWCLVLLVLLFPWQAFLRDADFTTREFVIPGVLYTWNELLAFARFDPQFSGQTVLKWARFVGFPVVAVLILMVIQIKSNRGLRQALGEDDLTGLTGQ